MSTQRTVIRWTALAGVLLLLGGGTPGCKKKDGDKKDKPAAGEMAPGGMTMEAGGMDRAAPMAGMEPAAMRPAARPAAPTAAAVTVDGDLKKKLAEQFSGAAAKGFDKLIKQVEGSQKVIDGMGKAGKELWPMYHAAAKSTKEIAKAVSEGKYGLIPMLVLNGNVAALMAVKMIAKAITDAGRRAANAARKLNVGGAKKHAAYAKRLGHHAKVAGELLKHYVLALEKIVTGKSDGLRVGLVAAGIEAAAKAGAATKKVIVELVKKLHDGEKVAAVKAQMAALLKKL